MRWPRTLATMPAAQITTGRSTFLKSVSRSTGSICWRNRALRLEPCNLPPRARARSAAFSGCQRRVQGDFGVQQLGHGTTGLRLGGELVELRLIRARDLGGEDQMNRGDGEAVRDLVQRDLGLGFHMLGLQLGFAQNERQRHRETTGVGGADQLLRVRAGLPLETAGKAVWIFVERAALCRDGALAVPDAAFPDGRSKRHHLSSLLGLVRTM